jgi:hypothetical protein
MFKTGIDVFPIADLGLLMKKLQPVRLYQIRCVYNTYRHAFHNRSRTLLNKFKREIFFQSKTSLNIASLHDRPDMFQPALNTCYKIRDVESINWFYISE